MTALEQQQQEVQTQGSEEIDAIEKLSNKKLIDEYKNLGGKKIRVKGKFNMSASRRYMNFFGAGSQFNFDTHNSKDRLESWNSKVTFLRCVNMKVKRCNLRIEFVLTAEEIKELVDSLLNLKNGFVPFDGYIILHPYQNGNGEIHQCVIMCVMV